MNLHDTIVAIATPPGRGGIGVVRISGPDAASISARILRFSGELTTWTSRLAELVDDGGQLVDEVVVTVFLRPRSYTAEDVVEISCHGAPVVLRHCLERAMASGARLAKPGEFTMRAYLNGRINLPQAEAVRDLIDSTTLYQAQVAARQTQGGLAKRLAPVRAQLIELIALLEAGIDFAEDDIDVAPPAELRRRIEPVLAGVEALERSFEYGRLVKAGFALAIAGRPNAGKSSLFNRLLGQDRAIVTPIAGTTRDAISESIEISGIPVRLVDTAGIRESHETVERLGIERSFEAMADADVTVVVIDAAEPRGPESGDAEKAIIARATNHGRVLVAANKCDLPHREIPEGYLPVSALTGQGIEELRAKIIGILHPDSRIEPESFFITNIRHRGLLDDAAAFLRKAETAVELRIPHEMLLLDLYGALQALGGILGETTGDDILTKIFSTFCIGK